MSTKYIRDRSDANFYLLANKDIDSNFYFALDLFDIMFILKDNTDKYFSGEISLSRLFKRNRILSEGYRKLKDDENMIFFIFEKNRYL